MTNKLKGKIAEKGYSVKGIAIKSGLKQATLHRKVNGSIGDFKVCEVLKLKKTLELTNEEIYEIFFDCQSQK